MEQAHDEADYKGEYPCPHCTSSDAYKHHRDGWFHCFSCGTNSTTQPVGFGAEIVPIQKEDKTQRKDLLTGEAQALKARHLTEETCRKWGYIVSDYRGEAAQVAVYRSQTGVPVAQKVRQRGKKFSILGDAKSMGLFGQHLWNGGKKLVITEGEIDAMSVSQLQDHKWPVVSLPNGAQSAERAIKETWDYIDNFEEVILMFDQDDAGREAAGKVAELLPVGKAKIAILPLKDANECLINGRGRDVISAIWNARTYRPDGIVAATDLREAVSLADAVSAIDYPYEALNNLTKGIREGELVTITAGSGIGKSTLIREIAHHLHTGGERVGMIMLEESNKRTLLGLVGIELSKNITVDRDLATDEEIDEAFAKLFSENDLFLYDHFGSSEVENICNRIRYMAKALGCKYLFLDHISLMVSGIATTDERKLIDMAMTKLRTLVQELNIGLFVVSHLRRPEGDKGHEDGAAVRLGQLRGSHAIAQLSDVVLGLQVDPEEPHSDRRQIVVSKNRYTGETGPAGIITYDTTTGRLTESPF